MQPPEQLSSGNWFPKETLKDQGSNFTSLLMKELCNLLKVKILRPSVYHQKTAGLLKCFHKMLKEMLRKFVIADPKYWDQLHPPLLLTIQEVPQFSMSFSPFEIFYGRQTTHRIETAPGQK